MPPVPFRARRRRCWSVSFLELAAVSLFGVVGTDERLQGTSSWSSAGGGGIFTFFVLNTNRRTIDAASLSGRRITGTGAVADIAK